VGGGLTVATIPAFAMVGYNENNFGLRLSVDEVFAGIEAYGRLPFDEASSSFYFGGGIGLRPYAFWTDLGIPPQAQNGGVPISASALIGVELRTENIGYFLEYAPAFPISGDYSLDALIGLFHAKLGVNYYF
jgi:hypothetical protein